MRSLVIGTWNINGMRAAYSRGFTDKLVALDLDVLCVQETRLGHDEDALFPRYVAPGYESSFAYSGRAGHAGLATLSRNAPYLVDCDPLGANGDGRALLTVYEGWAVLNVYCFHGGRDGRDLSSKLAMYSRLLEFVTSWRGPQPLILAGDFNVAHTPLDVERAAENRKSVMFSGEERDAFENLLSAGYIDAFRFRRPLERQYTWWPYAFGARARNIGWRLDYILLPADFGLFITAASSRTEILGSDHCPVVVSISNDPGPESATSPVPVPKRK